MLVSELARSEGDEGDRADVSIWTGACDKSSFSCRWATYRTVRQKSENRRLALLRARRHHIERDIFPVLRPGYLQTKLLTGAHRIDRRHPGFHMSHILKLRQRSLPIGDFGRQGRAIARF